MSKARPRYQVSASPEMDAAADIPFDDNGNGEDVFMARLVAARRELYACALFLTRDRSAADDLVQTTLERGLAARHRCRPETNVVAWLKSILRNLFIDERRHAAVERRPIEQPGCEATEVLRPIDLLGIDDVIDALACLRSRDREVLQLAYFEHVPYSKISARIHAPMSTTGTRLFRAKARVRQILQKLYAERLAALRQTEH